MKHWVIGIGFMGLVAAGAARSEVSMAVLVGDWRGSGDLTARGNGPRERGRCQVEASQEDGNSLTIHGRCAVAAGRGTMTLRLIDDGNGQVRAGFRSPLLDGVVQLIGTMAGNTLTLISREPYLLDGELRSIRTEVMFETADRFVIREWHAPDDGSQWRLVTEMTFIRSGGT